MTSSNKFLPRFFFRNENDKAKNVKILRKQHLLKLIRNISWQIEILGAHTASDVPLHEKGTLEVSISQTEWERDFFQYAGSFPISDWLYYQIETA